MKVMELAGKLGGDIEAAHPAAGPRARNENRILIHPVMKQLLWICAGLLLTFYGRARSVSPFLRLRIP